MLNFEIFIKSLRRVFREFLSMTDLTSETLEVLPKTYQSVTARIDLSGDAKASVWLNLTYPGALLAMKELKVPFNEEDRMLMDAVGELLNMIVGAAQRDSTVRYDFSLPMAQKGERYSLSLNPKTKKSAERFVFEEFEATLLLEEYYDVT